MKNRRRLTGAAALSLTALATTMGAQPAAAQDVAVTVGDISTGQFDVFQKANPAFLKIGSPAFDKANPAFLKIGSPAFDKANPAFLKIIQIPGD